MKVICLPIFKSLQKLLANAPIVSGDTPQASSENPPPGDFIPLGIRLTDGKQITAVLQGGLASAKVRTQVPTHAKTGNNRRGQL